MKRADTPKGAFVIAVLVMVVLPIVAACFTKILSDLHYLLHQP